MTTWNSGGFFFFITKRENKENGCQSRVQQSWPQACMSRSSPCVPNHSAFRFCCQVWITAPDFSLISSRLPMPLSAVSSCSHFTKHQRYLLITESQWISMFFLTVTHAVQKHCDKQQKCNLRMLWEHMSGILHLTPTERPETGEGWQWYLGRVLLFSIVMFIYLTVSDLSCGIWDLWSLLRHVGSSSLTRDQTPHWECGVLATGLPGKSWERVHKEQEFVNEKALRITRRVYARTREMREIVHFQNSK